jgi:hypothetical protein
MNDGPNVVIAWQGCIAYLLVVLPTFTFTFHGDIHRTERYIVARGVPSDLLTNLEYNIDPLASLQNH